MTINALQRKILNYEKQLYVANNSGIHSATASSSVSATTKRSPPSSPTRSVLSREGSAVSAGSGGSNISSFSSSASCASQANDAAQKRFRRRQKQRRTPWRVDIDPVTETGRLSEEKLNEKRREVADHLKSADPPIHVVSSFPRKYGGVGYNFIDDETRMRAAAILKELYLHPEYQPKMKISTPPPKGPTMLLVDVPSSQDTKEIADSLNKKVQNPAIACLTRDEHESVKFQEFKKKRGILFTCTKAFRNAIKAQDSQLTFGGGWATRVEDHVSLFFCYACGMWNHSADHCERKAKGYIKCVRCGSDQHFEADCPHKNNPSMSRCANCTWSNQEDGTNYPCDHATWEFHKCSAAAERKENILQSYDL